ncbi:MAG: helix-turn-helix transcriptional regulator [Oscillospiraceae bacterium]|jgi:DNA-binding XRE family transcriptional regulator
MRLKVQEYRILRRMTIRELAKRAGVAKSSIEVMESALPNPTLQTLYSVAKALNVRIQDLIEYEDGDE